MQHLLSYSSAHQQKPSSRNSQSANIQSAQKQLMDLYETRLKSLIQTVKIYQQNLDKDSQSGALAFMNTQEMGIYRIDRQFELLKDVLLTQKQKLVIKVLTSLHEMKRENDQLRNQSQLQRGSFAKSQIQNVPEKDIFSKASIQKQSRMSIRTGQKANNNSNSRLSIISNANQITSSASISVYEKLLQEKLILIKELQKKNKQLTQQHEQNLYKINQLTLKLEKSLTEQLNSKQCLQCVSAKEINQKLIAKNQHLSTENQRYMLKLREQQCLKSTKDQQLKFKDIKLKQLEIRLQNQIRENQLRLQLEQQQKNNKPNPQANLQTIKELKEKLILQQHQLMSMSNSFQFLKQDISDSLSSEIKRLKNSHQLLKQNLKSWIVMIKNQMLQSVAQIIEAVKLKSSGKKDSDDIAKKLRQIDNELDFFIEQKNIRT